MHKNTRQGWLKHVDFILLDELCLLIASITVYLTATETGMASEIRNPFGLLALTLLINVLVIIASDFLGTVVHNTDRTEAYNTLTHGFYLGLTLAVAMLIRDGHLVRPWTGLLAAWFLYVLLSYYTRIGWRRFLFSHARKPDAQKALLVVVHEEHAAEILGRLKEFAFGEYAPSGLILLDRDAKGEVIDDIPVVANLSDAGDYMCRSWTDDVLFYRVSQDPRAQSLVESCREMALTLHFYAPIQGVDEDKQTIGRIAGVEVLTAYMNQMGPYDAFVKRLFDLVIGAAGSLAALLAMAVVAPKIRKASPGPLLFRQERVGENGKKFMMYKIRSMYLDADKRKAELENANSHSDGMMFKMDFDPRVIGNEILPDGTKKTGIGEFIRRSSLDELPQFFNVLRGEMSVVGTRPPTLDEWEKYKYHHRARMSIRPGVTGLWQISPRKDEMSFEEVVRLDTEYIAHWTISEDFRIMFQTLASVFKRSNV